MSHVKNVEAFDKVLGICTGYGGKYNPGQQNLQVNAMTTLSNSAQQMLEEINSAQTEYDNATNSRELAFKDMRKLSASIFNVLKSSGAHNLTLDDARVRIRKLRGEKAPDRRPVPSGNAVDAKVNLRSAGGRDFGSQVDHFNKLLETLSAEAHYQPNEPEFTVQGLTETLAALRNKNDGVKQAEVKLSNARRKRNALLYTGEGNLFSTAKAAKLYVRGVFGIRSEEFRNVSRIHFNKT